MLILVARQNEQIVIDGGRIVVTVVEHSYNRVKLGFTAARSIPIHRGEVQARIAAEALAKETGHD